MVGDEDFCYQKMIFYLLEIAMRTIISVEKGMDGPKVLIVAAALGVAVLWLLAASWALQPVLQALIRPTADSIFSALLVGGVLWPLYVGPLALISRFFGWRRSFLTGDGVHVIDPNQETQPFLLDLWSELARMAEGTGLPCVPVLAVAEEPEINAYALGTGPADAAVVLNRGLLERLDRDAVLAVMAHEIGHIAHRDMALRQFLSIIPQAMYDMLLRPAQRIRIIAAALGVGLAGAGAASRSRDSGSAMLLMGALLVVVAAFMVPLLMLFNWLISVVFGMLDCALSRRREFRADAMGAALRGYDAMIQALQALADSERLPVLRRGDSLATAKIVFAAQGTHSAYELWGLFPSLFQTHPTLQDRIDALRADQLTAVSHG